MKVLSKIELNSTFHRKALTVPHLVGPCYQKVMTCRGNLGQPSGQIRRRSVNQLLAVVLLAGLAIAGSAAVAAPINGCQNPEQLTGQKVSGSWTVGAAFAMAAGGPLSGGSNLVNIAPVGDNLTLFIEGRRIPLVRSGTGQTATRWSMARDLPNSSEDYEFLYGCSLDRLPRWTGMMEVNAEGTRTQVAWELIVIAENKALLLMQITAPIRGFGIYTLERELTEGR